MVGSATKVTVFGGTGFLGRYVVRQLAAEGKVVTVAVRHPEEGLYLKTAGNVGQVVLRRTDLLHPGSVAAALAGADEVVNLVGILYETGRYGFDAVQRDGAAHVAEAAARANVRRLVHVSAIGADLRSPAAYARSKAGGERAIREAFPEATILRPSILVGPEDDFFNRFALMAQFLPALPLIGGGHTKFQPVYVGDVADAVSAALA
ncbi:MAG: complex I NDUFA9 subunit family protein, partial [Alphaproteobacteria bacterium]